MLAGIASPVDATVFEDPEPFVIHVLESESERYGAGVLYIRIQNELKLDCDKCLMRMLHMVIFKADITEISFRYSGAIGRLFYLLGHCM